MSKELKSIDIIGIDGKNCGKVDVDISRLDPVKAVKVISDVALMYMSNTKKRTANTKTRSEINLTNKKPWKQKGTGRARAGSARSPIWVGGGVAHGPRPRDVYYSIPEKLRKKVLKDSILMKISDGNIIIIDGLKFEKPKTCDMKKILGNFNIKCRILLVTDGHDRNIHLSARNIANVEVINCADLNVYEVLKAGKILFTKSAFDKLSAKIAA